VAAVVVNVTVSAVAVNSGGGSADGGESFTYGGVGCADGGVGCADGDGGFADGGSGFGQSYANVGDYAGWLIEANFLKNSYFSLKNCGWLNK
jgi:hypothetical protein